MGTSQKGQMQGFLFPKHPLLFPSLLCRSTLFAQKKVEERVQTSKQVGKFPRSSVIRPVSCKHTTTFCVPHKLLGCHLSAAQAAHVKAIPYLISPWDNFPVNLFLNPDLCLVNLSRTRLSRLGECCRISHLPVVS